MAVVALTLHWVNRRKLPAMRVGRSDESIFFFNLLMKCSFAVSAGSGSKTEILSTWIRGNSEKSMSVGSAVRFVCGAAAFQHFLGANCRKPASASGARSRKATSKMKAAVVGTLGVDIGVFPGQRGRAACVHNSKFPTMAATVPIVNFSRRVYYPGRDVTRSMRLPTSSKMSPSSWAGLPYAIAYSKRPPRPAATGVVP